MSIASDLRGYVCAVVFDMPLNEWPFSGSPAWVFVVDSDGGMLKLKCRHGGDSVWVSTSLIKTIRASHRE